MFEQMKKAREEEGFTLIELLITIVVVGILSAVVVLSIDGLTNSGQRSACKASQDAAQAAAHVYYANQTPPAWPTTIKAMIDGNELTQNDVTLSADGMSLSHGTDWTLTMTAGAGTAAPTFSGCP